MEILCLYISNHFAGHGLHMPKLDDLWPSPGTPEGYGFLEDEKILGLDSLFYQASKWHTLWKAKWGGKPNIAQSG